MLYRFTMPSYFNLDTRILEWLNKQLMSNWRRQNLEVPELLSVVYTKKWNKKAQSDFTEERSKDYRHIIIL